MWEVPETFGRNVTLRYSGSLSPRAAWAFQGVWVGTEPCASPGVKWGIRFYYYYQVCKSAQDIPFIPLSFSQIPFLLIHSVATHRAGSHPPPHFRIKDMALYSQKTQQQETGKAVWIWQSSSSLTSAQTQRRTTQTGLTECTFLKLTEVANPVRVDKILSASSLSSHRKTKGGVQLRKLGTLDLIVV